MTSTSRLEVISCGIKHCRRTISRKSEQSQAGLNVSQLEDLGALARQVPSPRHAHLSCTSTCFRNLHCPQAACLSDFGTGLLIISKFKAHQRQILLLVVSIRTFASHMFGGPKSSGTSLFLDACDSLPLWQPSITLRKEAHRQVERHLLLTTRHQTVYIIPHSKPIFLQPVRCLYSYNLICIIIIRRAGRPVAIFDRDALL